MSQFKFTHHHLAGSKKYTLSKTLKDTAKVALLVKDDTNHFLSENQRAELLVAVGDKYEATKKKPRQKKVKVPKLSMQEAAQTLTVEQIIEGLKNGTIEPATL